VTRVAGWKGGRERERGDSAEVLQQRLRKQSQEVTERGE